MNTNLVKTFKIWSHKFLYDDATNTDISKKKIYDPLKSNLDFNNNPDVYSNYNKLCGTFCIKENNIDQDVKKKVRENNYC